MRWYAQTFGHLLYLCAAVRRHIDSPAGEPMRQAVDAPPLTTWKHDTASLFHCLVFLSRDMSAADSAVP